MASPREAALVVAVLILPLGIILIAFSGGFTSERFRKRKFMGMVIVIMAVTFPLMIDLAPFASSNQAAYAPLLHSQLNDIMLKVYGSTKIPPIEGQQAPKGEMGPREMQAIIEDRKRKPRIQLLNDADASTPSEGPVSEILYYHTDHLGLVRVITLSDGSVWKRTDYMPFGEIAYESFDPTSSRSQLLTSFGYTHPKTSYTGQERDINTGLYYYGARFYDAEMGRFLQVDPVANIFNAQSMNGFSYVSNNPVILIDPTGMQQNSSFWQQFLQTFGLRQEINAKPILSPSDVSYAQTDLGRFGEALYGLVSGMVGTAITSMREPAGFDLQAGAFNLVGQIPSLISANAYDFFLDLFNSKSPSFMPNLANLVTNAVHEAGISSPPLTGEIFATSPFGDVRSSKKDSGTYQHQGTDLWGPDLPYATSIRYGQVVSTEPSSTYGNQVVIQFQEDGKTFWVRYAHLADCADAYVNKGDFVIPGQWLGQIGKTGQAKREHLHIEILDKWKPGELMENRLDPMGYVRLK